MQVLCRKKINLNGILLGNDVVPDLLQDISIDKGVHAK
jgi:hypothetical protein